MDNLEFLDYRAVCAHLHARLVAGDDPHLLRLEMEPHILDRVDKSELVEMLLLVLDVVEEQTMSLAA